jgi:hypothetical protein
MSISTPESARRERRYGYPPVNAVIRGRDFPALRWSLEGFLADDRIPTIPVGTIVEGILTIKTAPGIYRFTAQLNQRDDAGSTVIFAFIEPSKALLAALERAAEGY